ncbi:MAG: hypothetical protein WBX49_00395 [Candidatus Deferrimicrobiaceae bacterium]
MNEFDLEKACAELGPQSLEAVILRGFARTIDKMAAEDRKLRKQIFQLDRRIAQLEARSQASASRPVRALGLPKRNSR